MFRINHLQTVEQNLLRFLNSRTKLVLTEGQAIFGAVQSVTPGAGNGNRNTQLSVSFSAELNLSGTTNVFYDRLAVNEHYPGVSTSFTITNADSLATFKTQVAERFKVIESEISISGTLPSGGSTSNLTVDAVAGSRLYKPGAVTLSVQNTSAGAAFPVVRAAIGTAPTGTRTTHPITLPGGIAVGDYLVAIFAIPGNTASIGLVNSPGWSMPDGYGAQTTQNTMQIAVKRVTDASNALSFTTSVARAGVAVVYRISGTSGLAGFNWLNDTSNDITRTVPDLAPPGVLKRVWLCGSATYSSSTVINTPSGWALGDTPSSSTVLGSTSNVRLAVFHRSAEVSNENTGTYTHASGVQVSLGWKLALAPE